MSLPFLHRLATLNPQAEIHIITAHAGFEIFCLALERGLAPFKSRLHLHLLEKRGAHKSVKGLFRFVSKLKEFSKGRPDCVYLLQRSARSGLLALLSGSSLRVGFSSGSASFFYSKSVPRFWETHQSELDKNLDLLRANHGIESVGQWSTLNAPSLLKSSDSVAGTSEKIVSIALGSPWPTKRWPAKQAAQLASKLTEEGITVHLLGDDKARGMSEELKSLCPSLLVKDYVGHTSIKDWVGLIEKSNVVVCNDSAATHVASDLNVACVSLFGPTLPDFGFAPWRKRSVALGLANLECRPCHIHGPLECPLGHHKCLNELSGESVYRQVFKLLQMS